jgi:uncharacterized 2Fe-2S/4Fe-4S cluster protein (DUF4445 family)
MLHLLHGLPCDTLGVYPFAPVEIGVKTTRFGWLPNCEAFSLPGISTFVGADITAGMLCLGGMESSETRLLVDLGTNGEMALMHQGGIWVTSTAAGPAFEAGNISQGVPSVAGAINWCRVKGLQAFEYTTIGNAPPIGICGTGVVAVMAELVRYGRVDETGRLGAEHGKAVEIAPGIAFAQNDIRQVQLAKSAVRTGIELLLEAAACTPCDVKHVYVAGGFGSALHPQDAQALGLFPHGLVDKAVAAGNTALGGAVFSLLAASSMAEMEAITAQAVEVNLAAHPKFNELFMEHMLF